MTTEAQRLIKQATPLPWTVTENDPEEYWFGDGVWEIESSDPYDAFVGVLGYRRRADAALIAYAVNRLPAYEAAVEVLRNLLDGKHGPGKPPRECNCFRHRDARAALARLRDEVPV